MSSHSSGLRSLSAIAAMVVASTMARAGVTITVNPSLPASSTNFTTIQSAVDSVSATNLTPTTIQISSGVYDERILIPAGKDYITLKGNGASRNDVILTAHDWMGSATGWEGSQPLRAYANNFRAENLTLRNTWGDNGQATALRSKGDKQVYENVVLEGWQDTYLSEGGGRTYFHNSEARGRVDFIYGSGNVVFDQSTIVSKVTSGNGGYITAANTPASQKYGFTFLNSTLSAISTDGSSINNTTYLGRPWGPYASVAFINTTMGPHIKTAGWDNWGNPANEATARYSEYGSTGAGGNMAGRVGWSTVLTPAQAALYTPTNIFNGWDPLNTPLVPVIWVGSGGNNNWSTASNWDSNVSPLNGQNLYIQPASTTTVNVIGAAVGDSLTIGSTSVGNTLNVGSGATLDLTGTLFLNGGSTVNVDGGTLSVNIVNVPTAGTSNQIVIKNNGQLNINNWNGAWGPSGRLVINKGTFAAVGIDGTQILMAPNIGDVATLNIRPGDAWTKTRFIETGDGTSVINQTGGSIDGTYGPYLGNTGSGVGTATYNFSGGTTYWLDPVLGKSRAGTFTVNQTGGTMYAVGATGTQQSFNDGLVQIGHNTGANGTWNISNSASFNHRGMGVGGSGNGKFIQNGGSVTLYQPYLPTTRGMGLHIAYANNGSGLYQIANGSLTVTNGGLTLGYDLLGTTAVTGTGKFLVQGGGSTINIIGDYKQNSGSVLAAYLNTNGLSTININGNIAFNSGSLIDIDGTNLPSSTFVLLKWTGTLTGSPIYSPTTDKSRFSFAIDPTAKTLSVTIVPEPGVLAIFGGISILGLRRRDRKDYL